MEVGTEGFDDWEMLEKEAATAVEEEIVAVAEAEGNMMLRLDYFSVDDDNGMMIKYSRSGDDERSEVSSDEGVGASVESDNPSWIDPTAFPRRSCGELWPDSASDRSKMSDCEEKLGFVDSDHRHVFEMESQGTFLGKVELDAGESTFLAELSVLGESSVEKMDMVENPINQFGKRIEMEAVEDENEVEQPVHVEKKALLWLKLPLELVKFCVFRISPVWSISVAAAMVGMFVIRKRLQMMKRKTKGLQVKVTMDDKKVDKFMSHAARLNEAFSVVSRVPITRPSFPPPGVTPWPVVSIW